MRLCECFFFFFSKCNTEITTTRIKWIIAVYEGVALIFIQSNQVSKNKYTEDDDLLSKRV